MFCVKTTDLNYCTDVTLFVPNFLGRKLSFYPILCPEHAEQVQTDISDVSVED